MSDGCPADPPLDPPDGKKRPAILDLWEVHQEEFVKERGTSKLTKCIQDLYNYLSRIFIKDRIRSLDGHYCKIYSDSRHTYLPQIRDSIENKVNSLHFSCFTGLLISDTRKDPLEHSVVIRYHVFKTNQQKEIEGVLVMKIPARGFSFPDSRFMEIGRVNDRDIPIVFLSFASLKNHFQLHSVSSSDRKIILGSTPIGGIRHSERKIKKKKPRAEKVVPDETEVISDDEDQYSDADENDPLTRRSGGKHKKKQAHSSCKEVSLCPDQTGIASGSASGQTDSIFSVVPSCARGKRDAAKASPPLVQAFPLDDPDSEYFVITREQLKGFLSQLSPQAVVESYSDFGSLSKYVKQKEKLIKSKSSREAEELTGDAWNTMLTEIQASRKALCEERSKVNKGKKAARTNPSFLCLDIVLSPDLYAFGELFQQFLKDNFVGEIVGTKQVEGSASSDRRPCRVKKFLMNVEDVFPEDIKGMREPKFFIDMRVQFTTLYSGMFLCFKLRESGTLEWTKLFRESDKEELTFVIFGSLDALNKLPPVIREGLCLEDPTRENRFFFTSVQETTGVCEIETLRELCSLSLVDMCKKYDHEARAKLRFEEQALHEIMEDTLHQQAVDKVNENNEKFEAESKSKANGEKSRKAKNTLAETLNGKAPLVKLPAPERRRVVIIPLMFIPLCNSDLGFQHNEPCLCGCGGNPITTQVFTRYMGNAGTREGSIDRSLLTGMTLPRSLLGIAQCLPLCFFYSFKPVLSNRLKR
jgi:hypothetical protein